MKNLLIMRHAKSSWEFTDLSDHDRPLNNRGKRDAPRMGKVLLKRKTCPPTNNKLFSGQSSVYG